MSGSWPWTRTVTKEPVAEIEERLSEALYQQEQATHELRHLLDDVKHGRIGLDQSDDRP